MEYIARLDWLTLDPAIDLVSGVCCACCCRVCCRTCCDVAILLNCFFGVLDVARGVCVSTAICSMQRAGRVRGVLFVSEALVEFADGGLEEVFR